MRRAVEGRVNSVFLEITLPLLKVVVVTLATGVAFALRVRVLRALGAVVDLGAVAVGIGIDSRVYPHIIPNKKPLLRGLLHNVVKKSSLLTVLIIIQNAGPSTYGLCRQWT